LIENKEIRVVRRGEGKKKSFPLGGGLKGRGLKWLGTLTEGGTKQKPKPQHPHHPKPKLA